MKFTVLVQALLLAGAVHAQRTCPNRLKQAIDDLDDCQSTNATLQSDLATCKKTNRGPMYAPVNCSTFKNGNVRARGDEVYKIYCNHWNMGQGLKTADASTVEACMSVCDVTHGCVGGDYYPADAKCYLKKTGMSDATVAPKTDGRPIAFFVVGYI